MTEFFPTNPILPFLIVCPLIFLAGLIDSIAGHYIGSGIVMKKGFKAVKPIILAVLALLIIKMLIG